MKKKKYTRLSLHGGCNLAYWGIGIAIYQMKDFDTEYKFYVQFLPLWFAIVITRFTPYDDSLMPF